MTYEEEEGQEAGLQQQSVSANRRKGRSAGGGAKLKICLSESCLVTVLLWPIRTGGGVWLEQGAWLTEGRG